MSRQHDREAANRLIARSSRGWLAYLLALKTDFQLCLQVDATVETNEHDTYNVDLCLTDDFINSGGPIDLRGNVVLQVARKLCLWVERLRQIANALREIPEDPYEHLPKAYVTKDATTGEVIGVRLLLSESVPLGTSYEEITNSNAVTEPDDFSNWPELAETCERLLKMAGAEWT